MLFDCNGLFLFFVIIQYVMLFCGIFLILVVMKSLKFNLQKNKHAGNNLKKLMD